MVFAVLFLVVLSGGSSAVLGRGIQPMVSSQEHVKKLCVSQGHVKNNLMNKLLGTSFSRTYGDISVEKEILNS